MPCVALNTNFYFIQSFMSLLLKHGNRYGVKCKLDFLYARKKYILICSVMHFKSLHYSSSGLSSAHSVAYLSLYCVYFTANSGLEPERPDILFIQMTHMPHTEEAPGWDVYLHPPGIFGQWRMLGGWDVAAGEGRWSSKLRKEHRIQTVQMIFRPWEGQARARQWFCTFQLCAA